MTEANKLAKMRAIAGEIAALARRSHDYCEDTYYACPQAIDQWSGKKVGPRAYSDDPNCSCGADEHNAKLDALLCALNLIQ